MPVFLLSERLVRRMMTQHTLILLPADLHRHKVAAVEMGVNTHSAACANGVCRREQYGRR